MMAYQVDINVMSSLYITFSLATLSMIGRLVARKITKVPLWWDDYLAIAAWLMAVGWAAFTTYWATQTGLGHLVEDVPLHPEKVREEARFGLYIIEMTYAFSLAFSKLAILCFYWRLFSTSNIRRPIQILQGCTVVWLTIRTFMTIFHCVPVQAYWDHSIKDAVCNIDDSKFMFGTTLVHLLMDLAVLALPIVQVKSLKLRLAQKVAVACMFMFGIFVCVASIVVLISAYQLNPKTTELAKDITPVVIWAGLEVNFAIISACLPMMRPVVRKLMPGSMLDSNPSQPISGLSTTKGIKLTNVTRSKEVDDNSSQRQLADLEDGSSDSLDFDHQHTAGNSKSGITTRAYRSNRDDLEEPAVRGIQVKNEMRVHYESA